MNSNYRETRTRDSRYRDDMRGVEREVASRLNITGGQVFLQPIAAPFVLGLLTLSAALWLIGPFYAHWYGGSNTLQLLAPFVGLLGISQIIAAIWAFRARDTVATALLGTWGAFWTAFAGMQLLRATGALPVPSGNFTEFGWWYVVAAGMTLTTAIAASYRSGVLGLTFWTLTATAVLAAVGQFTNMNVLNIISGYGFMLTGLLGWYTATAYLVNHSIGRDVWPIGRVRAEERLVTNIASEPGVIRGE